MGELSFLQQPSSRHHSLGEHSSDSGLPLRNYPSGASHVAACTTPNSTVTYSSIAPFSYNGPYDSSLPTPVSVAGSPSLSDGSSSVKMAHSYSNAGSVSQQHTPPGTSRPSTSDWYNNSQSHGMIRTTQPSSPLTINPTTDLLGLHGLGNPNSPPPQVVPGTSAEHYWGHYTVSSTDPADDMSPPMPSTALFSSGSHVNPSALLKSYPMQSNSHIHLAPAPPGPFSSSVTGSGPMPTPMTPGEDLHNQAHFGLPQPLILDVQSSYKRNSRTTANRRGPARKRQRGRTRRPSTHSLGDFDDDNEHSWADSSSPARRMKEEKGPRRVLKLRPDDKKPEDHYLFSLKEEFIEYKGRGMWDKIVERYQQRYEKKERAALQMQLTRAVARLAIWPAEEDRALLEAIAEYDKRRYTDILKIMKEKNGARVWDWKPEHIAKRLAELGEEEFDPEMKPKKIRRRRKELLRQRDQPNLWAQPSPPPVVYDEQGLSVQTRHNLTVDQEETILKALFKPEPASPAEADVMDISESYIPPRRTSNQQELSQAHSERVAKQACEQLIAQQHQDNSSYYGSRYANQANHHQMS